VPPHLFPLRHCGQESGKNSEVVSEVTLPNFHVNESFLSSDTQSIHTPFHRFDHIFPKRFKPTMKFALTAAMGLLLTEQAVSFAPFTPISKPYSSSSSSSRRMAMDMPAAQSVDIPVIQKSSYGPTDVRYSDFLKLVNADQIEKVTFSADGTQLLGVDVEGTRVKIEALPNDPDLLTQLTQHKVGCLKKQARILLNSVFSNSLSFRRRLM